MYCSKTNSGYFIENTATENIIPGKHNYGYAGK